VHSYKSTAEPMVTAESNLLDRHCAAAGVVGFATLKRFYALLQARARFRYV